MKIRSFVIIFFCLLNCSLFSQKLHMIVIVYPDDNVGVSKDKENILTFANEVCSQTELTLNKIEKDNSLTENQFESIISNLSINSNDVVWVYYTGHGKNFDTWPKTFGGGLALSSVHKILKETNARLTISIYDCCNYSEPEIEAPDFTTADISNIQKLFLSCSGHIIACSSESTQFSYGSSNAGGIFTNSFIDAFNTENDTWEKILNESKSTTSIAAINIGKTQTPKYDISDLTCSTLKINNYTITTKSGDTFSSIAKNETTYLKSVLGKDLIITEDLIKKWNPDIKTIKSGDKILIKLSEVK